MVKASSRVGQSRGVVILSSHAEAVCMEVGTIFFAEEAFFGW
jgi:hypothetical protein